MPDRNKKKKKAAARFNPALMMISMISNFISVIGILIGVAKGMSVVLGKLSRGDIAHLMVLGGDDRQVITTDDFRGGLGACAFGNGVLDLSKTGTDKQPASLLAMCLFGNLDVKIPKDWKLRSMSMQLAGEYQHAREGEQLDKDAKADVEVYALVLFGKINLVRG